MLSKLPQFTYRGVVLDYADLKYNPCNDIIFPSVIHVDERVEPSAAEWLMYYAPHDPPGGICVAVADCLGGPWREHPESPLIVNEWLPHYCVSHVSSPHAVYSPEEKQIFLYFHGENSTTRYATSADGIHFQYGGVCVTDDMFPGVTGAFYARVFRRPGKDCSRRWLMLFMGHLMANDEAAIFAAWSADGRTWEAVSEPVVKAGRGHSVCAPWLVQISGRDILLCHADRPIGAGGNRFDPHTDIVAYEMSPDGGSATRVGIVLSREDVSPDNLRASDPCLIESEGQMWLFHTIGARLNQKIALSIAPCQ